jgi:hypothetical protein
MKNPQGRGGAQILAWVPLPSSISRTEGKLSEGERDDGD